MRTENDETGLISMEYLELISQPSQFEHLLSTDAAELAEAPHEKSKSSHAGGTGNSSMKPNSRDSTGSREPAPELPPKRASFSKSNSARSSVRLAGDPDHVVMQVTFRAIDAIGPFALQHPLPFFGPFSTCTTCTLCSFHRDLNVCLQVSAGTHFGVPLSQAPRVSDPRFAYEIPEILVVSRQARFVSLQCRLLEARSSPNCWVSEHFRRLRKLFCLMWLPLDSSVFLVISRSIPCCKMH